MVNKFFKEFSGNKTAFKNGGYETTLANNIVFIMDEANNGAGACIFARGMYFGNFAELIAALTYIKNIKVGENTYSAQGGATLEFAASTPSVVTLDVQGGKVTIGLTPTFVQSVNDVINEVAAIKGDYLKASDKEELTKLVNDKDAAMKSYVDTEIAKMTSSESFAQLESRIKTIEDNYLDGEDKTELQGAINTEKGRVDAIVADYLKGEDKTALQNAINVEKGRVDGIVADYLKASDKEELANRITNEAPVTMETAAGEGEILNVYTFKQNGAVVGVINTRKELVVTGGDIVEIDGVKNLQLSIANQETPVNIPVSELVDVYTAGDYVSISDKNVISVDKAAIINGLATDANAQSYASTAESNAKSHAETKIAEAIEAEVTRSNAYADGKASAAQEAAISHANTELAKKADKSYVDETFAQKANTYTKTEVDGLVSPKADKSYVDEELAKKADKATTYTKAEVEAMFDSAFAWEKIG